MWCSDLSNACSVGTPILPAPMKTMRILELLRQLLQCDRPTREPPSHRFRHQFLAGGDLTPAYR